jgi:hypothetical protein
MKKLILAAIAALAFAAFASAKQVTVCSTYIVGATVEMDCQGDFNGKSNIVELYKKGWSLIADISGANKFILVFEK